MTHFLLSHYTCCLWFSSITHQFLWLHNLFSSIAVSLIILILHLLSPIYLSFWLLTVSFSDTTKLSFCIITISCFLDFRVYCHVLYLWLFSRTARYFLLVLQLMPHLWLQGFLILKFTNSYIYFLCHSQYQTPFSCLPKFFCARNSSENFPNDYLMKSQTPFSCWLKCLSGKEMGK